MKCYIVSKGDCQSNYEPVAVYQSLEEAKKAVAENPDLNVSEYDERPYFPQALTHIEYVTVFKGITPHSVTEKARDVFGIPYVGVEVRVVLDGGVTKAWTSHVADRDSVTLCLSDTMLGVGYQSSDDKGVAHQWEFFPLSRVQSYT